MNRMMKRLMAACFTLAIFVAMTFSTTQLLMADDHCPIDGWNVVGFCDGIEDCQPQCDLVHGPGNSEANCLNGCCVCML